MSKLVTASIRRFRRPAEFAEDHLVTGILDGTYPPGTDLPAERTLAEAMGITRPTLRETLQRLGREGWVHIRHGKPTRVADIWRTGGLGLLSTLARYGEHLPERFISHLLAFRAVFLPPAAAAAAATDPAALARLLADRPAAGDSRDRWVSFDWQLQRAFCRLSGNPLFLLIINDFDTLYHQLAPIYFSRTDARASSMAFYDRLRGALAEGPAAVTAAVAEVMNDSLAIWRDMDAGSDGGLDR